MQEKISNLNVIIKENQTHNRIIDDSILARVVLIQQVLENVVPVRSRIFAQTASEPIHIEQFLHVTRYVSEINKCNAKYCSSSKSYLSLVFVEIEVHTYYS